MHARAAAALRADGDGPSAWAHHVARYATSGDREAIEWLMDAARSVTLRAPATSAQWLAAALELLPESAPPARRLTVLVPLATALAAAGELEGSRVALLRTLALLEPGAATLRARAATHRCGRCSATPAQAPRRSRA